MPLVLFFILYHLQQQHQQQQFALQQFAVATYFAVINALEDIIFKKQDKTKCLDCIPKSKGKSTVYEL